NVPRLENQTTDPRGFTTIYRHDADGNLVQRRDPDGAVWDWEYDGERNVVRELDPFARERTFSGFDARGNPAQILDRDGRSTQLTYDPVSGAPAQVTDKRGNKRTVAYSADGLPTTTRATIGGQAPPGTLLATNEYDPASRRLTRTTEALGDNTGRSRDTGLFYEAPNDPTDRDLSRIETRDESGAVTSTVEYLYDALGRRTRETVWRKRSFTDPTLIPLVTETLYNDRDQLERLTRPDGTTLVVQYDKNGNPKRRYLEERRPDGALVLHDDTQLVYDAMDRLVRVIDAAGGTTEYAYDASGNRVSMEDPEGHTWRFEYDPMNRPTHAIDPNGAVGETEYDPAGRPVAMIDPTGIVTTRGYDEIGRLESIQQGANPLATRAVFYAPVPSPCSGTATAYCEKITDPEGRTTTYEFDDLGRVFRVTDAASPPGVTLIAYNLLGAVQRVTDPAGQATTFTFDTRGRTVSSQPPHATALSFLVYDETGNVIRQTSPGGCRLELTYDVMGRLTQRRGPIAPLFCPASSIDDEYGYDARGLLVVARNSDVGLVREYDALGRMTREIDDRFANSVGYAFDRASRLTSKVYPDGTSVHYTYDGAGRTVGISDPFGDTTRFLYDAAGRRVQKRGTSGLRTDYT
ncbi:MAG: hypothetical protein L0206_10345, partial [Actinobacteria bacterium]|nr:hypothetical protein [Actinomycetota bacterium]